MIYPLPSILDPLKLEDVFGAERPVEVELGCGDGSFIVQYAALNPECSLLGVERLLGRLRKTARKAGRRALTNVRLIRIEASYLAGYLLPPASIQAFHIYFPDPWPKRKHQSHRLINSRFASQLLRVLGAAGRIYLRTDNPPYFAQMNEVFRSLPGFREISTPDALASILTDFETEFNRRGVPTLRAAFERL